MLDALADVVTVDSNSTDSARQGILNESSAASYSGQAPMSTVDSQPGVPTKDNFDPVGPGLRNRKATAPSNEMPAPPPPSKGAFGRFANAFRRHHTDEKDVKRREKERRMQQRVRNEPSRMDIIDRMDLSGLGASLFHHDSPYDACSPHSNRNSRRAPVNAFDHTIDPMTGQPIGYRNNAGGSSAQGRAGLSPLAAATMRKMSDNAGDVPDDGKGTSLLAANGRSRSQPSGQVPLLGRNQTSSSTATNVVSTAETESNDAASSLSHNSTIDRDVEAERAYRNNRGYFTQSSNASRARADLANPNADIWGVSSEPWQDFAQPTSKRLDVPSSRTSGDGLASAASSIFDMEAVMTGKQPTSRKTTGASALGGGSVSAGESSSTSAQNDGPKRSKSLIKRIKHARQYGNVPPPDDDVVQRAEAVAAANGTRATSGGQKRVINHHHSPSTPPLQNSSPQFNGVTLTDGPSVGRSGTLRAGSGNGYSAPRSPGSREMSRPGSNQGGSNLGRNGSIFNRIRGGKSRERDVAVAR